MNKNYLLLLIGALVFTGCVSSQAPEQPKEGTGIPPQASQARGITEEALTRSSAGSAVSVDVTFLNPLQKNKDELIFRVALNTHTVDVLSFKIDKLAALKTSDGIEVNDGFVWVPGDESSHHRSGYLKISAKTKEGTPLISEKTEYIVLEIRGIEANREFKWERDVLKFM